MESTDVVETGALDGVDVLQALHSIDDGPVLTGHIGGNLGHLHPENPPRPSVAVGEHRDTVGHLEGDRIANALLALSV